jgi:long-chain-alcohol oxidase
LRLTHAGIKEHSRPNQKLKEGLERLGVHCGEIPRNCSTAHTCGHCCFGCPSGDKQDMTGTYLSDAAAKGARIFTGEPCTSAIPHLLNKIAPAALFMMC